MLRMPSTWAPTISEWTARALRSRMRRSLGGGPPGGARGPRGRGGGPTPAETTKRPAASFSRRVAGSAATSGAVADGLALSLIVGLRLADGGSGWQIEAV